MLLRGWFHARPHGSPMPDAPALLQHRFSFLEHAPLVERDLALVEPDERWIGDFLAVCRDPLTLERAPEMARVSRHGLLDFLSVAPRGRFPGDPAHHRAPAYHFWMVQTPPNGNAGIAGAIALRIGDTPDLRLYVGHIGYNVFPPRQGQHLAERACRLVLPLARQHGLREVWITANPENTPSRRTCERLGATLVDVVGVPPEHELFRRGERRKCRYRLELD